MNKSSATGIAAKGKKNKLSILSENEQMNDRKKYGLHKTWFGMECK